jgi:GNAT superfamily N-acetyltransferase
MRIRAAELKDAEAIALLHAESWRVAYRGIYRDEYLDGDVFRDRKDVWQERLTSPAKGQFTIVAEEDDNIVGFACAIGEEDSRWGTLLDNLHVDPQRKRGGIGTQLVGEVAMWARREHPDSGLYLWVLEANPSARRFYERLGGRNAEQTTSEPAGGGIVSSLRYAWPDLAALVAATEEQRR